MKKYKVTFREWVYQEKEVTVEAPNRAIAHIVGREEMINPSYENREAEFLPVEYKALKPKIRIINERK